ncbi:MAG TPA: DUF5695 domain-containing protein [Blastocatellia bacterium]|nr:DUF5695 domain-containing protein [Blastocatellia bacterium]HMX28673.1 DUF5695 domain-containing protein [Blastocatellia bacterium]HMZ18004.1 DUF5695 domain-containing protein [Blastocatellia bacterium]HNG29971.1 DUF5695 domain-containing protein [Blastocatellia bacterium]
MNKNKQTIIVATSALLLVLALFPLTRHAQNQQAQPGRPAPTPTPTPTLGLEQGYLEFDTPDFTLKLVKASQTIAALIPKGQPKGGSGFDFTPADRLERRASDGHQHLGDLTIRVRVGSDWKEYSTAAARKPVTALAASGQTLAAADLAPTLPADCPVQITRSWALENGRLALRYELKNKTSQPLEIGALGIPMAFNNHITGRNLQQSHEICSFADPYIGQDAGYLQVTRLSGKGPALVVVPEGKTPFEAWQLLNEPMRPAQTFEGTFAWMSHSRAYAETEWKGVEQWNSPTSATLAPNASRTYGVRFLVSDEIRNIEKTLAANNRPVAVGIPGYVLPQDLEAKLFLNSKSKVAVIAAEPAGAITIRKDKPTANGWQAYTLRGQTWGRARLLVKYADGNQQSISYYIIKPSTQAVADLGNFLFTKQWFVDPNDPFRRSPSVMSYDREADKIVSQDSRVWIAGLGDEGGSGSWLAAAMKQFGQPKREEIAKYEQFIDKVLWGGLQYNDGPNKYGVRKSMLFYSPADVPGFQYDSALNWTTWTSWKKADAESIGRGYNYPHVIAAYWSMYRVARNTEGLVKNHPWDWYLEQAYQTTKFTFSRNANNNRRRVGYVELGLMEGDIFLNVLLDLKREGWMEKAADIEKLMRERSDRWKREAYPFGSEMAWDSTGQEEVYAWCDYFGYDDKALVSLNSIIGYMPTVPHWGYNGNARRYWDFLYGGKLRRIERQIHHYGSGINAIPALSHFRKHPEDDYLLRIGYGGTMGALTNIDREGFASAAFHSFPSTLKWDAYSGDYGPNFFGHALNTATYLINHPEFGWQAFGGNVTRKGDWVSVTPLDSMRMRVYLAPRGLWLTLDAGRFETVELNAKTGAVRVSLASATSETPQARLRIEQPAKPTGVGSYQPSQPLKQEREAFVIPLKQAMTWIELSTGK